MAVESPQLKIDPYQSQVPLVQLPVEQGQETGRPAPPLQGNMSGKGTAALGIGDALLKGFMQGHAVKELRKYKMAEADIGAAKSGEDAAWKNYQDALATGKAKSDPNDPYYTAYTKAHQVASDTMAHYTMPQKQTKGKKGQKSTAPAGTDVDAASMASAQGGFMGRIKGFLAANPTLVPQVALAMRIPNKPGMTADTQTQQMSIDAGKLNLENAQRNSQDASATLAAKQTYAMFAGLTSEELAALPKAQQDAFRYAENYLRIGSHTGAEKIFVDPQGNYHQIPAGVEIPEGWKPASGAGEAKPGSPAFYAAQYAKANGVSVSDLSLEDLDYLRKRQVWDAQRATSTTNSSTVDTDGNRTSTSSKNIGAEPTPPKGRKASADVQGGGMTAPPPASAAPESTSAAKGAITAPPRKAKPTPKSMGQPKLTLTDMRNLQKVSDLKSAKIQKANDKYQKAIADAQFAASKGGSSKDLEAATKAAKTNLASDLAEVDRWYNEQTAASGAPPPGATVAYVDGHGNIKGYGVNGQYVAAGR